MKIEKQEVKSKKQEARRGAGGFTLIELLLVVVIILILAGVVVYNVAGKSDQARIAAAKADISTVGLALDSFDVDIGRYPTSDEGLAALMDQPSGATGWKGPYLKKAVTNDPWGTPYQYTSPPTRSKVGYDLWSFGPDKRDGGNDDISSWEDNK